MTGAEAQKGGCALRCAARPIQRTRIGGFDLLECPACGLLALGASHAAHSAEELERGEFEGAFFELRTSNYAAILSALGSRRPERGRLLDVGCSSGWFLAQASAAGWQCAGIEPDRFFFDRARAQLPPAVPLVNGYFDRDLPEDWKDFDVITFHDVFEHIPDPLSILAACRRRLSERGSIVLSVPAAGGFVYRIAEAMHRVGVGGPFERVYQVRYPYPHLYYFSDRSMGVLAERAGLRVVARLRLRGFSARGAFHRARMDRADSVAGQVRNLLSGCALLGFAGLQHILPPDNVAFILSPGS